MSFRINSGRVTLRSFTEGINTPVIRLAFTLLMLGLAIWFFKHEKVEFASVRDTLGMADWRWVLTGLLVTVLYIVLQGLMYVSSFAALQCRFTLKDSIVLFLKRNFVSVFLPAGGISSLAFFTGNAEKKGITRTQIYLASAIYGYCGILSVILVGLPFLAYAIISKGQIQGVIPALGAILVLLGMPVIVYRSFVRQGIIFRLIQKSFPTFSVFLEELRSEKLIMRHLITTLFFSVLIEFTGILHVAIAMLALGFSPTLFNATLAYLVSVLFLILAPFLRGLGAIEMSMSIILVKSGLSNIEAISIVLLYRFFEFWAPLVAGLFSFIYKANKLLMRVLPAAGVFFIGLINIISVLTPVMPERFAVLQQFVPLDLIHTTNTFVLIFGFFLIALSATLLQGMRTAWWMALVLTIGSAIGHLVKGFDYEEASVALFIGGMLVFSRKEYNVLIDSRLRKVGIQTALIAIGFVFIYGITGFYFLDARHFHVDFNLRQSVQYTFQNFLLVGSPDLHPSSGFAKAFISSLQICGGFTLLFLFYTLVRPFLQRSDASEEELAIAHQLVQQYGRSSLDYFKTYFDKVLFITEHKNAFIAFRVGGNYAVALENPVAENADAAKACIIDFSRFCYNNGLKDVYYRIPEEDLPVFHGLRKKSLLIGEVAVVDTSSFTLDGGDMKSVRNALRKVKEQGFAVRTYEPPLKDGLLQKLKAVSDEWLSVSGREEIVFSQGIFVAAEIKQQPVVVVENAEEMVIAFANVIPDHRTGEGTFDLIRKTADAPNGVMDFLMVALFEYFKQRGIRFVDIGFAPLSGLEQSKSLPESTLKFAYHNIRTFAHYKGQREYKDKFKPAWSRQYLVYTNDFDLLQLPVVLKKVIKL